MPTDHRAALAKIKRFDQLIAYLRDEMGWPIARDSFEDVNDLFYDFTAAELGIDAQNAAKIQEIKRLRPLSSKQPWGVFFVKFEPKNLPVVALRRILSQVALKKRPSANSAERAAWAADDLLFISNYGEGDERQISFAHFSRAQDGHDLPTLKVLGWDNLDTALHLDNVAKELTEHLAWPDDDEDVEGWRNSWRAAFNLRHREVVTTSQQLSIRLAELARAIRDRIKAALVIETDAGPLTKLMRAFQEALVHDLDADGFADMYAQTIAYGLLSARIADPEKKTTDDFAAHMRTNPFLRELMETFLKVGGRRGKAGGPGIDFDELGVSEVVELLDDAKMEAVVQDFGDRNPLEDPVIHFYELFLKEYDAKKRMQRGVFYTPRPVVSYIVRSVDESLRTEFGLSDGLADTATWGEMKKRHEHIQIPQGIPDAQGFIQILDPATGTGTFLVEVIDLIHKTLCEKWKIEGRTDKDIEALWNEYVPKHLLTRLHGYELLMAPYAIAHLKVGLKLYETGYRFGSDERARIYLTNALEPPNDDKAQREFEQWVPALAHEARAVNAIKRDRRFTVVIGNPPYSGVSSNRNDWIEGLLKGESANGGATANYYEVDGEPLGEKKIWLQDDYVKFIRLSHFLIDQSSLGIHGMITNHSYVDSPTCRGMRFQLRRFFSHLNIVDLHGSTKKGENAPDGQVDDNVFDILPGVAIAIFVKDAQEASACVQSLDLWGTRSVKFDWLLKHTSSQHVSTELHPAYPYYLFVKRQLDFAAEYRDYYSLKDIFPFYGTGIQTSRDEFATDYDRQGLEARLRGFFDTSRSDKQIAEDFGLSNTRGWEVKKVRRSSSFEKVRKTIVQCMFRSFDKKWIALTKDIVDWPRSEVMACVGPGRIGLLCSRQQSTPGFRHALVVNAPADMFCISNKSREGQSLFPLFIKDDTSLFQRNAGDNWRPNLGAKFAEQLVGILSPINARSKSRTLTPEIAEAGFAYVYAILHSSIYRTRYEDLLKMDFPRVPLGASSELVRALARVGRDLIALHLLEAAKLDDRITLYSGPKNPEVERIGWSDDTVWLDAAATRKDQSATPGTIGFRGVSEAVWNFHIGGYQVCEKWLKDRRGRTLSKADIVHYQMIVRALAETIRLMKEVDDVIEEHGGWPGAFAPGEETEALGDFSCFS
ncbi:type ISP restriction/modification enzyme [Bradyrhizobium sp. RT5a]|uniref:type ISP restriction/modification enzyme n=1 Tax=Bradyrhizobium sp. RT5a TaxID=3156380 RepID=UPI0033979818